MPLARNGRHLVVPRAMSMLPNYCIKCGDPGAKNLRKTYSWHHPGFFLLVFLSPIVYAILAAPFCKRMALQVSLCKAHATRRLILLLSGTLLLLGSIPLGIVLGGNLGIAVGTIGTIASFVVLIVGTNLIRPVKMNETEATYTGLGEPFLKRFPGT